MEDMNFYNKHYISIREDGCIIDGFSDAFREPTDEHICINEQGGYQFRLFPGGEENPSLFGWDGMIPLYKYDGEVIKRTEAEIEADRAEIPKPTEPEPTIDERVTALEESNAEMTEALDMILSGVTE